MATRAQYVSKILVIFYQSTGYTKPNCVGLTGYSPALDKNCHVHTPCKIRVTQRSHQNIDIAYAREIFFNCLTIDFDFAMMSASPS